MTELVPSYDSNRPKLLQPTPGVKVEGYDIDDTLIKGVPITWVGEALSATFRPLRPEHVDLRTLPDLDFSPQKVFGIKSLALKLYTNWRVLPGVKDRLDARIAGGRELFALSGRPATQQWYDATVEQLRQASLPIKEVYLRPPGIPAPLAKAIAVRRLGVEVYTDNDLVNLLMVRVLNPKVDLNYIQHRNDKKQAEMARRWGINVTSLQEWSPSEFYSPSVTAVA